MNAADLAREMVAYDRWATGRIFAAAAGLDTGNPSAGASWKSIDGSMRHVAASHATWLSRWNGEPTIQHEAADEAGLRAWFDAVYDALEGFVAGLDDQQYLAEVTFSDSRGNPHRDVLALLLAHAVNHGTYHRGEAALLLTEAGHSPGDLDLVVFRRMQDPTR
ncbi:MAG: DinB family protein [Candidatus Dormibacteria bacterium]